MREVLNSLRRHALGKVFERILPGMPEFELFEERRELDRQRIRLAIRGFGNQPECTREIKSCPHTHRCDLNRVGQSARDFLETRANDLLDLKMRQSEPENGAGYRQRSAVASGM